MSNKARRQPQRHTAQTNRRAPERNTDADKQRKRALKDSPTVTSARCAAWRAARGEIAAKVSE